MASLNDPHASLEPSARGIVIRFIPVGPAYGSLAALAVVSGLHAKGFSGRCEYYSHEDKIGGDYLVGLGIKHLTGGGGAPDAAWWTSFASAVADACKDDPDVQMRGQEGEITTIGDLRARWFDCGAVEFRDGMPKCVLGDADSWFTGLCQKLLEKYAPGNPPP
jgi:hypothetical protein